MGLRAKATRESQNWSLSLGHHALGASKEQSSVGKSLATAAKDPQALIQQVSRLLPKPCNDPHCVPDSMLTVSTWGLSGRLEESQDKQEEARFKMGRGSIGDHKADKQHKALAQGR